VANSIGASPPAGVSEPGRELIAGHAARLFASWGLIGASLHDLADECGIRQSSLYHHPSKEAIFVDVVNRHFDIIIPELMQAAEGSGIGARRRRMIETTVDFGNPPLRPLPRRIQQLGVCARA
jgi:AcrR family transcriptional regulator